MRLARPTLPRPLRLILTLALAGAVAAAAGVLTPSADAQTGQEQETAAEPGFIFRLDGNPSRIFRPEAVWEVVTGLVGLDLDHRFEVAPGGPITTNLQAPARQAGGALVPFRDPAPAFSRNILVTRDFSNAPIQTEPHIAVDPNDPDHVVVGAIDYSFPGVVAYVTFDAGENWEGPFQSPFLRDDLIGAGDPVVGFDREGNVYMLSISIGVDEFTVGNAIGLAAISSIQIAKSRDGGFTWDEPISTSRSIIDTQLTVDAEQKTRGTVHISFLDKPWIGIGPDPSNPEVDVIYVTYTRFNVINSVLYSDELTLLSTSEVQSTIQLVRSSDGGLTWSDPVNVSPVVRRVSGDTPGGRRRQRGRPEARGAGVLAEHRPRWLGLRDLARLHRRRVPRRRRRALRRALRRRRQLQQAYPGRHHTRGGLHAAHGRLPLLGHFLPSDVGGARRRGQHRLRRTQPRQAG